MGLWLNLRSNYHNTKMSAMTVRAVPLFILGKRWLVAGEVDCANYWVLALPRPFVPALSYWHGALQTTFLLSQLAMLGFASRGNYRGAPTLEKQKELTSPVCKLWAPSVKFRRTAASKNFITPATAVHSRSSILILFVVFPTLSGAKLMK